MAQSRQVAIIGYGHVGKAMQQIFPDAVIYDKYDPLYTGTRDAVNRCYLSIICVPTPERPEDGACDISAVEEVVGWVETPLILIKSAVAPGTTDYLKEKYRKRITVSPEYFGESRFWLPDIFSSLGWPYLIVGGDPEDTQPVMEVFVGRLGPAKTYRQTTAATAELTKYMENAWLATQVTFANEFYEIATAFGVDYLELRELWALDPRVSKWHTLVFPESRGFGGKCLPKDLKAIVAAARGKGHNPLYFLGVLEANEYFRSLSPKGVPGSPTHPGPSPKSR